MAAVLWAANVVPTCGAEAGDASAWARDAHSSARLIAGDPPLAGHGNEALDAGVEIALQSGWKTYWRYPGDSGVPPSFDFSGSRNLRRATVRWPAPTRFPDGSGTAIGYADGIILPLRVEPERPSAPVELLLKLGYAVCRDLCVPVEATLALRLPAAVSEHAPALKRSEARVPRRVALGAAGPLRIVALRQNTGARPRVVVDVATDDPAATDLLAEGPSPDWSLPLPARVGTSQGGMVRFAFDMDGAPPGISPQGATLILTAVTPHHAIEVSARLD